MYSLPKRLLVVDPIKRYLLNTPMQPYWAKDADGGYTCYIQNESPAKEKKRNWLYPRQGFVLYGHATLPAEQRGSGRHLEGAAADEGLVNGRFPATRTARSICTPARRRRLARKPTGSRRCPAMAGLRSSVYTARSSHASARRGGPARSKR
jgi:Protein of unknown function (DUF1214)